MIGLPQVDVGKVPSMDYRPSRPDDNPRFLGRQFYSNLGGTDTLVVATPGDANFCVITCVASGAYDATYGVGYVGSSGMIARKFLSVIQGQAMTLRCSSKASFTSKVTIAGVDVCLAAAPSNTFLNVPALAAAGIGDLIIEGLPGTKDAGQGISYGAPTGAEPDDGFRLFIGGTGAVSGPYAWLDATGYGGGGAKSEVAGFPIRKNGPGLIVLSFWSADPR